MTPEQAACIATVQVHTTPGSPPPTGDCLPLWRGLVTFHGYPDAVRTSHQARMLDRAPIRNSDSVAARLSRLREAGHLYRASADYTMRRDKEPSPFSVLGAKPDDLCGQCALVYRLSSICVLNWTLATAFSIPFSAYGERLMIGEQLHWAHDPVDAMARDALGAM